MIFAIYYSVALVVGGYLAGFLFGEGMRDQTLIETGSFPWPVQVVITAFLFGVSWPLFAVIAILGFASGSVIWLWQERGSWREFMFGNYPSREKR